LKQEEKSMDKKYTWRLLAVMLVVALLAACAPAATPTEAPEVDTPAEEAVEEVVEEPVVEEPVEEVEEPMGPTAFSIAISTNIDTFDPHLTRSFAVANVVDYMVETLLNADVNGQIVPALATDWEISDDGMEYTFFLQEGVLFSDGTPFNAEAVKFNIERFQDEELPNTKNPYNKILEVVAVDETTVKFVLGAPSSELLPAMSNTNVAILSPTSIAAGTEAYMGLGSNAPVGTGPYTLKEYLVDDQVTVERNPNYWGDAPYYDEVVFRIVPEAATRESLLLSGQVDMAVLPPLTDLAALEANPDAEVIMGDSARIIFIALNTTTPYLDDPRVRQALNYAVDVEAIVNAVLLGNGVPVVSPMPASFFGFCETEPYYEYNPEKAKELLADAGVPEDFELRAIAPTGRYAQDFQVAEAVSGFLADVGITAAPQTSDWGTYMDWVLVGPDEATRDMYLLGWAGGYPHGSHTMTLVQADAFFNRGYYNNPELNELIQAADAAPTAAESADLYCQANQIIWDDAPWIFLYQQGYPVIHSPGVDGIIVLPSEKFDAFGAHPVE
jgi:ABC-type transport system substrate-binding protein